MTTETITAPANFIRQIVEDDLRGGKHKSIVTRFPPEPNGYLHVGHAKSIWLNFGLAKSFGGVCHLRMDDTNPLKEDAEYVEAIKRDIRWLGFEWGEKEYHAADYFQQFYDCAVALVKKGKAYVCDLSADEVRQYARLEHSLVDAEVGQRFQFERHGYFIKDQDSNAQRQVFNRIVPLKDGWAKILKKA